MNLILHQFVTDLRHFRAWLFALWLAFAIQPVLSAFSAIDLELNVGLQFLLVFLQALFALFLVARLVQTDATVGSDAGWMTRPLRRPHLFWAKTAFIALCVLLPKLLAQSICWAARGFSFGLWLEAAAELSLFCMAFLVLVAALAALTKGLPQFFLSAGLAVGGLLAAAVSMEALRWGHLSDSRPGANIESLRRSAMTAAFLLFIVCASWTWAWQTLAGRRGRSIAAFAVGLLAFMPVVTFWPWNFLVPRITQARSLSVTLLEETKSLPVQTQTVGSLFALGGLAPHSLAVVEDVSARFVLKESGRTITIPRWTVTRRMRPQESQQGEKYWSVIKGFFPPETLWFGREGQPRGGYLLAMDNFLRGITNRPARGSFQGDLVLDHFDVVQVADLPLKPASRRIWPGQTVTIQSVERGPNGITVRVDESLTELMFDCDQTTAFLRNQMGDTLCTYVLYHARSGEALALSQNNHLSIPSLLNNETHRGLSLGFAFPALRERLAGISADEWLREVRLCLFMPVYKGTSRYNLKKDDVTLVTPEPAANWRRTTGNVLPSNPAEAQISTNRSLLLTNAPSPGSEANEPVNATLPRNASGDQIAAYLDALFTNAPPRSQAERLTLQERIFQIGPEGLPVLIRRLPVDTRLENLFVRPALQRLATREHLPELLEALRRDPALAWLFLEKKWEADAREVLRNEIGDHRIQFSADALRLVAEAKDPATCADLAWHFVRLKAGQAEVLPALEQCPGFDLAGTVREAWKRAQLGLAPTRDLAVAAAAQGLPDALNTAVVDLETLTETQRRPRDVSQLASLTGYVGPADGALDWLSANLGRFRYDSAKRRYVKEDRP